MSLTATGTQVAWHDPGAAEENKCCCGGCCLFSAGGGSLDEADWPSTIVVNGVTLSLETGAPDTPTYSNGDITLHRPNSSFFKINFYTGDLQGSVYQSGCLIGEYVQDPEFYDPVFPDTITVEDEFEASYVLDRLIPVTGDHVPVTVTRISPCEWTGEDDCGGVWRLVYGDDLAPDAWAIFVRTYLLDEEDNPTCTLSGTYLTVKKPAADGGAWGTPEGDYLGGGGPNMTVSVP